MTAYLKSHRTTDIKPEMLSGVQTGNGTPHDKYNIRGIAHARTNRKDNIFMQRRLVQNFTFILEWGQETCSLYELQCVKLYAILTGQIYRKIIIVQEPKKSLYKWCSYKPDFLDSELFACPN